MIRKFMSATLLVIIATITYQSSARVIHHDERIRAELNPHASKVGMLMFEGGVCTGFLISPKRVVSALHCFSGYLDRSQSPKSVLFTINGKHTQSAQVIKIISIDHAHDLVILHLDAVFKDYFVISPPKIAAVSSIGVDPVLGHLMLDSHCYIKEIDRDYGLIFHDCDGGRGSSGAPIIQNNFVIGMHLGYSKSYASNVAISLSGKMMERDSSIYYALDIDKERWGVPKISLPKVKLPRIPRSLPEIGGALSATAKKAGKDTANTTKKAEEDTAETVEKAEKDIANTTKKAGEDTAETTRKAGEDTAVELKRAGGQIAKQYKQARKDLFGSNGGLACKDRFAKNDRIKCYEEKRAELEARLHQLRSQRNARISNICIPMTQKIIGARELMASRNSI